MTAPGSTTPGRTTAVPMMSGPMTSGPMVSGRAGSGTADRGTSRFVADAAAHPIDEWGRNEQFIAVLDPLFRLRWSVRVDGLDHLAALPQHRRAPSGVLLVTNRRWWALDLVWVAWALGRDLERPVRFVGHPDRIPSGPVLRRIGALIEHPAEVRGALRHGEAVLLGASASWQPRTVGAVDPAMVATARELGAPVLPVAAMSSPLTRRALLHIGPPVAPPAHRRGPLADTEFAERVQHAVQQLLHRPDGGVVDARRIDRPADRPADPRPIVRGVA